MRGKNYKAVKAVLWAILFANFAVAAIKIGVGIASGSQSVTADGIHSFGDGASNIVGLIGIWLASKPRDEKHPYGHGKYEILASLFIGVMLAALSIRVISRAVFSFGATAAVEINAAEVVLMAITIAINTAVAITEYRLGKKLDSTILVTDSMHTRGDIFISSAVLLGLLGIRLGLPVWADGAMSLAVAAAVLYSAWKIIRDCADVLVDSAAVNCEEVKHLLLDTPGVCGVHKVRSRGEHSHVFIDLHVTVSPQENIVCVHGLSHRLEAILKEHFGENTEVNIHMEPENKRHIRIKTGC